MAVFCASFLSDSLSVARLSDAAGAIAGRAHTGPARSVSGGTAAATTWHADKAIKDVLIRDPEEGSWLLVAGTPLLSEEMRARLGNRGLLRVFLDDMAGSVRAHLDGCFAVVAHDAKRRQLFAASDYNRTVPIFHSVAPSGALLCGSELALAQAIGAEIDPAGFAQTIQLGTPWGARTRFTGISMLKPASVLTVNERLQASEAPYWRPADEATWRGGLDAIMERWAPLLADAVLRYYRQRGTRPFLCDFTAGEDARLVMAQCHALGLPYQGHVGGFPDDKDVTVAAQAAAETGFTLKTTRYRLIEPQQLTRHVQDIVLASDGYANLFTACIEFAAASHEQPYDLGAVKIGGLPGGEAFRGSYYTRARLLLPSLNGLFPPRFFTRLKFLLDYRRGLLRYPDDALLREVHVSIESSLAEVVRFADGIKVDHLLRIFQTCSWGLMSRRPAYLPMATSSLTRSIYSLPPRVKQRGALTKALTECLFPQLAWIHTQNGVPTVRRSLRRLPLFVPEYVAALRAVARGFASRVLKLNQTGQALRWYLRVDYNRVVFQTLLNEAPYAGWFRSCQDMKTGYLYEPAVLDRILDDARKGHCRALNTLSRILSQELAYRWMCATECHDPAANTRDQPIIPDDAAPGDGQRGDKSRRR